METKEIIIDNILKRLNEINNDEIFKKANPNISAEEYLYAKVYKIIKLKRLTNILNGNAKKITTNELCNIANALNVSLDYLVCKK